MITQKLADYLLFKQAYELIKNKEHLTHEGLSKIVAIKASVNKGLPDQLKEAFPDVEPMDRPLVVNKEIPDPSWLSGYQTQLRFQLTQQDRDLELMESIIKYLGCGRISKRGDDIIDVHVTKISEIVENIIPFFEKYPVIGVKRDNFKDFVKVAGLIQEKAHLTKEGLEEIRKIQQGMNSYRESST